MPVDVVVPQVGEAAAAVTVVRWFKQPGERVKAGEPLFEVDTEKVNLVIEAHVSGQLLEILAQVDAEVQPMEVVARILVEGEEKEEAEPTQEMIPSGEAANLEPHPEAMGAGKTTLVSAPAGRVLATPKAKRRAAEVGIDLAAVRATGPDGLISAEDVERHVVSRPATTAYPLSPRRKAIARRMTLSKTTIPHFYVMRDVEMTQAALLREYLDRTANYKPTYTALLIRACALALADFPWVNVSLQADRLVPRQQIDIGVAVAVPPLAGEQTDGLVVPVIRQADRKGLSDISRELDAVAARARANRLRPDDLSETGHSLIVSNLGVYRADAFVPIIDPPDAMILAAGAVSERPWIERGQLVVRPAATLTLAADHRILDGALGAQVLDRIREILENPYRL